jgi:hypothetical protein
MSPTFSRASLSLDAIRRPRDTPIWELDAALKRRSCRKGALCAAVHMIKLTETREITPYLWVYPDEERWASFLSPSLADTAPCLKKNQVSV